MKLRDLLKHLEQHRCLLYREGGNHTVYKNLESGRMTSVPRHREIKGSLVRKICDDLDIALPRNPK